MVSGHVFAHEVVGQRPLGEQNDVMLADFEKFNADIHRLNRACTAKIVLKSK